MSEETLKRSRDPNSSQDSVGESSPPIVPRVKISNRESTPVKGQEKEEERRTMSADKMEVVPVEQNATPAEGFATIMEMIKKASHDLQQAINASEDRLTRVMNAKFKEMEENLKSVESTQEELKQENEELRKRVAEMEKRQLIGEREGKRLNIVASGFAFETPNEGYKKLQDSINEISNSKIKVSGIRTISTANGQKIVATCINLEEKNVIMREKKKLKDTTNGKPIFISHDQPKEDREADWRLRTIIKQQRQEGKIVKLERGRIMINGQWMRFDREANNLVPGGFRKTEQMGNVERPGSQKEN